MDLDEIEFPDQFQFTSENYEEIENLEGFSEPENVEKISGGQDLLHDTKTGGLKVVDYQMDDQGSEILDWKELEQLVKNKTAIIIGAILTTLVLLCMVLNVYLAIKLCKKRSKVGTSSYGQMGNEQGQGPNVGSAVGCGNRNGESSNHFRAAELLSSSESRFNNEPRRDAIVDDIMLNQI